MPKKESDHEQKSYSAEEIISKLREAEVLLSQGLTVAEAARKMEIHEQTYYRWKKEYGGLDKTQAKRMKDLEKENLQLKKLVADLSLDNAIMKRSALKKDNRRWQPADPDRRREAVQQVQKGLGVSERRACRVINQPRGTRRYEKRQLVDEDQLRARIVYPGQPVWPLRVSAHHRFAASRRLAGQSQAGRAALASGRVESAR
jgi:putative transposase